MATPPKRWPTNAEWARVDAIALADTSWSILDELLDDLDSTHHVRQVGRVMNHLREIKIKLMSCK